MEYFGLYKEIYKHIKSDYRKLAELRNKNIPMKKLILKFNPIRY